MGVTSLTAGSGLGEDDFAVDSGLGVGAVAAGSGAGGVDVTGGSDVGDGAAAVGPGAGADISGVAVVHPAASNITSVRGIRIIDSFFILVLLIFFGWLPSV